MDIEIELQKAQSYEKQASFYEAQAQLPHVISAARFFRREAEKIRARFRRGNDLKKTG